MDKSKKLSLAVAPSKARKRFVPSKDKIITKKKEPEGLLTLGTGKNAREVSFLMRDVTANGPLMSYTDERCAWCRHNFETAPIGLPIEYKPSCIRTYLHRADFRDGPITDSRYEDGKWMDPKYEKECREVKVDTPVSQSKLESIIIKKKKTTQEYAERTENLKRALAVMNAYHTTDEDELEDALDVFVNEAVEMEKATEEEYDINDMDDVTEYLDDFKKWQKQRGINEKGLYVRLEKALATYNKYLLLCDSQWAVDVFLFEQDSAVPHGWVRRDIDTLNDIEDSSPFQRLLDSYTAKIEPLHIVERDYFITEFVFCSFNCAKAFAKDNQYDVRYRNSLTLLLMLFKRLYDVPVYNVGDRRKLDDKDPRKLTQEEIDGYALQIGAKRAKISVPLIIDAPSWKLIKGNGAGGDLSIDEYRESYCKCSYTLLPTTVRPYMFPQGQMFEIEQKF